MNMAGFLSGRYSPIIHAEMQEESGTKIESPDLVPDLQAIENGTKSRI
jgi:hypothetical protein